MLLMVMYICNKNIKTHTGMINNKFNMITSSLGRKEGNEIKAGTKEGIFNFI